jgi:hypothetical protein
MPRVKRKGHALKFDASHARYLKFGSLFGPSPFQSEAEERQSWYQNREQILENWNTPGARPYAYWRFELHTKPARNLWFCELNTLLDLGQIGATEAEAIERAYYALNGKQSPDFAERVPRLFADRVTTESGRAFLDDQASIFELAARFHRWRGNRALLVAKYTRLAGELREHLETRVLEEVTV